MKESSSKKKPEVSDLQKQKDAQLVERIKNDPEFAKDFFYEKEMPKELSFAFVRERVRKKILKMFGYEFDDWRLSTIVYEVLWSNGTMSALDSFSHRSTFETWLTTVASHCAIAHLVDERLVHLAPNRTPGNIRILWKKKSADYCRQTIEDTIFIPQLKEYLLALMVERLDEKAIKNKFNYDDETYELTKKAAIRTFKLAVLNGDGKYNDFISEKKKCPVLTSSRLVEIIGKTAEDDSYSSSLAEVFGAKATDPGFMSKVEDFLYDFSNRMTGWNEQDKRLWQRRFLENAKPKKLAEEFGHPINWVYLRTSRLKASFSLAIGKWWRTI